MQAKLDELQSQIADLQWQIAALRDECAQVQQIDNNNDDFAMGINDLLYILCHSLFRHFPDIQQDLEPKLKQADKIYTQYKNDLPFDEDDEILPQERYEAMRSLYFSLPEQVNAFCDNLKKK